MGGAASRELELAQGQVKRLSAELQRVSTALQSKETKLSAVEREAYELRRFRDELEATKSKLGDTSKELLRARRDAHGLPSVVQELGDAKRAADEQRSAAERLQQELKASKDELEKVFGQLKFAQTEDRWRERLRTSTDSVTEAERLSAQLVAEANTLLAGDEGGADAGCHPVFGSLLCDFGHKRLYSANPLTLWAGTLVWHRQRAFRQERAELIAAAKMRSSVSGWPGSLCVVETEHVASTGDGEGGGVVLGAIVDGQHRLGAAHLLSQKGKLSPMLEQILVEVYPAMEEKKVKELFTEINKVEPVTLIDLPDGGATAEQNRVLTAAAEALRERYPDMFKPSTSCRAPHLNVDTLRNELHRAEVLSRHKLGSAEALLGWLEERNSSLASRDAAEWLRDPSGRCRSQGALDKALEKAEANRFYLGLSLGWLLGSKS